MIPRHRSTFSVSSWQTTSKMGLWQISRERIESQLDEISMRFCCGLMNSRPLFKILSYNKAQDMRSSRINSQDWSLILTKCMKRRKCSTAPISFIFICGRYTPYYHHFVNSQIFTLWDSSMTNLEHLKAYYSKSVKYLHTSC